MRFMAADAICVELTTENARRLGGNLAPHKKKIIVVVASIQEQ